MPKGENLGTKFSNKSIWEGEKQIFKEKIIF